MKLARVLTIADAVYNVVEERIGLALNAPGKAQFLIDSNGQAFKRFQAIALDIGYTQHESMSRLFLGYIDSVVVVDGRRTKLFCREFSSLLSAAMPLNLRHPRLSDVLAAVNALTDIDFAIPDSMPYATKQAANFANVGTGFNVMANLGRVFGITDYIWQQQGDGVIFVGSWADSRYKNRLIDLPDNFFTEHYASRSASFAAIPALRPGIVLNGNRIKSLEFSGNAMSVTW